MDRTYPSSRGRSSSGPPGDPDRHLLEDILAAFADVAIFILDREGKIVYASAGAEVIYGYERAQLPGRQGHDIFETPTLSQMEELEELLYGCDRERHLEFDIPQRRKNGEIFPARVRFHSCPSSQDATVVVVDELENEASIDQLKRDFLSLVSHELRTPITSIKGAASMLLTGGLGTVTLDQERFLTIIERNCDRLGHLVSSLLDMTRLEGGKLALRLSTVNIEKLLREVAHQVREMYAPKCVNLEMGNPSEPVYVEADPVRLEQVFLHLLDNAFKFTADGGWVVTRITTAEDEIRIEIADTGVGIPPEDTNRIFHKFFQVDSSLTRVAGGAGLGLYMAKKLIKMHHGRIWVKSRPGKGTSVFLGLPRKKSAG
jgi:two-component system phosphate regulon sensor histidine kinase PhoR